MGLDETIERLARMLESPTGRIDGAAVRSALQWIEELQRERQGDAKHGATAIGG